jgi:transposase-like protein
MAEACELDKPFSGTIEVDESYFGPRRVKGKAGRGAGKKTPVFGIYKRGDKVHTEVVPDCSKAVLLSAIRGKVGLDSVIHSDGWSGYNGLATWAIRSTFGSRPLWRTFASPKPTRGVLCR